VSRPDARGGGQSFIRERRGHSNVEDGHVGKVGVDRGEQLFAGGGLCGHVDALFAEQERQPLPEQSGVLGKCYSHGRLARIAVPSPAEQMTVKSIATTPAAAHLIRGQASLRGWAAVSTTQSVSSR
jgi:hypothetical protein